MLRLVTSTVAQINGRLTVCFVFEFANQTGMIFRIILRRRMQMKYNAAPVTTEASTLYQRTHHILPHPKPNA
jgi:hypothetical protein